MEKRVKGSLPRGVDKRHKRLADGSWVTYYFYRPLGLAAGRLPSDIDDPEFYAEYARKRADWQARNTPNPQPLTLKELKTLFKSSRSFTALSASSRKDYAAALDAFVAEFGSDTRLRSGMDHVRMHAHIEAWHEGMQATPRSADMKLAVAARLLSFGLAKGHLDHNRALGIRRMYLANRAHRLWTPDHIDTFCSGAPAEMAVAARLAYVTAQRQSDLLRLTWSDVSDEGVTFRTSKTGVRIFVPMYDELRTCLAAIPKRAVSVLTTSAGRPWRVDNFRHAFRDACRRVGVGDGLHFHDLRGSALKAFADAGCSELELRAISGHAMSNSGALGSYIDAFKSLATNAVRKRENALRTKLANQDCKPSDTGAAQ